MKAIRAHAFGNHENLVLDEIPAPEPGPGEVLIEIRAAGVNPADTYMLTGNYAIIPTLPYIPGGDCTGVVAAVGDGVTSVALGDRVFVSAALGRDLTGCYAEYVCARRKTYWRCRMASVFPKRRHWACLMSPPILRSLLAAGRRRAKRSSSTVPAARSGRLQSNWPAVPGCGSSAALAAKRALRYFPRNGSILRSITTKTAIWIRSARQRQEMGLI